MGEESGKRMTAQVTWSGRVSVYENVKEGGRWAWKPVGQPGQDTIRRKSKEKGSKAVASAEKFAVINLVDGEYCLSCPGPGFLTWGKETKLTTLAEGLFVVLNSRWGLKFGDLSGATACVQALKAAGAGELQKEKEREKEKGQEIKLDGETGKLLETARKERRAMEKELNDVKARLEKLERGGGGGGISATMNILQSPSAPAPPPIGPPAPGPPPPPSPAPPGPPPPPGPGGPRLGAAPAKKNLTMAEQLLQKAENLKKAENQGNDDGGGAAAPVARAPPKMTMFEEMEIRRAKKAAQEEEKRRLAAQEAGE